MSSSASTSQPQSRTRIAEHTPAHASTDPVPTLVEAWTAAQKEWGLSDIDPDDDPESWPDADVYIASEPAPVVGPTHRQESTDIYDGAITGATLFAYPIVDEIMSGDPTRPQRHPELQAMDERDKIEYIHELGIVVEVTHDRDTGRQSQAAALSVIWVDQFLEFPIKFDPNGIEKGLATHVGTANEGEFVELTSEESFEVTRLVGLALEQAKSALRSATAPNPEVDGPDCGIDAVDVSPCAGISLP